MLDDQLTLLDGTEVITRSAAQVLTGLDWWDVYDTAERLTPETVLDGVPYFSRDALLSLLAGAR